MVFSIVLVILPLLVKGNINIYLSGEYKGEDVSKLKISYDGEDIGIISDAERNTFNLKDNNLKNAVKSYFGESPDDAYLHSPTPWGDLYKKYNFKQVTRTLKPKNVKINKSLSKDIMILQQDFKHNEPNPYSINVAVSKELYDTVSTSWITDGGLSIDKGINYDFKLQLVEVDREIYFSYNASWSKSTIQLHTMNVGASLPMDTILDPGQTVVSELHGTRASIQIEIEYEASLSGQTVVNYANTYKNRHFWGLYIDDCMNSAGLSNQKLSREVINIGFYVDSKVIVYDKTSGSRIMEFAF